MIRLRGLKVSYDTGFSLAVDSLDVRRGEIFAVIGPNGAGKTTLLGAMALLDEPAAGSLSLLGRDAFGGGDRLELRRAMSVVFSQPYLTAGTVAENVALPLRLRGRRDPAAVEAALALFRVGHLRDRDARTLSQGESHRTALARAFVTGPRLLLLDEPFGNLDERVREEISRDLRRVVRESGAAAVLVTQHQEGALTLGDRLAVMIGGRLLQQGEPQEIFARPASKAVADFVGVETVLPGRVASRQDNLCAVEAAGRTLMAVSDCEPGDSVFFCLRPESVSVSLNSDAGGRRNNFPARIISVEPWGLEYRVELDCGFPLQAAVTKQLVDGLGLKPGLEVYASFKAVAAHLIRR